MTLTPPPIETKRQLDEATTKHREAEAAATAAKHEADKKVAELGELRDHHEQQRNELDAISTLHSVTNAAQQKRDQELSARENGLNQRQAALDEKERLLDQRVATFRNMIA